MCCLVATTSVIVCPGLYVAVIDSSLTNWQLALISLRYLEMRLEEPPAPMLLSWVLRVRVWLCMMVSHCMYIATCTGRSNITSSSWRIQVRGNQGCINWLDWGLMGYNWTEAELVRVIAWDPRDGRVCWYCGTPVLQLLQLIPSWLTQYYTVQSYLAFTLCRIMNAVWNKDIWCRGIFIEQPR